MSLPTTGQGSRGTVLSVEESEQVEGALQTGVTQDRIFKLTSDFSTSSTSWVDLFSFTFTSLPDAVAPLPRLTVVAHISAKGGGGGFTNVQFALAIDKEQAGSPIQGDVISPNRLTSLAETTTPVMDQFSVIPSGDHTIIVRVKVASGSIACNASTGDGRCTVNVREVKF